jgi:hypothetical protein
VRVSDLEKLVMVREVEEEVGTSSNGIDIK